MANDVLRDGSKKRAVCGPLAVRAEDDRVRRKALRRLENRLRRRAAVDHRDVRGDPGALGLRWHERAQLALQTRPLAGDDSARSWT